MATMDFRSQSSSFPSGTKTTCFTSTRPRAMRGGARGPGQSWRNRARKSEPFPLRAGRGCCIMSCSSSAYVSHTDGKGKVSSVAGHPLLVQTCAVWARTQDVHLDDQTADAQYHHPVTSRTSRLRVIWRIRDGNRTAHACVATVHNRDNHDFCSIPPEPGDLKCFWYPGRITDERRVGELFEWQDDEEDHCRSSRGGFSDDVYPPWVFQNGARNADETCIYQAC
jgi:hypothetical protein